MNCNMTVKEAIKILQKYPACVKIEMLYYDFYGAKQAELLFSYDSISEKVYVSPSKTLNTYDDNDNYEEEYIENSI